MVRLRALTAGTEGSITVWGNKILETIQSGIYMPYIYIYHGWLRLKGQGHIDQCSASCSLETKSRQLLIFLNDFLLEHRHTLIYVLSEATFSLQWEGCIVVAETQISL